MVSDFYSLDYITIMAFLFIGSVIFACHKIAPSGTPGELYDAQLRGAQYTSFNAAPNYYPTAVPHPRELSEVSTAAYDLQYLGTPHQAHAPPYPGQWVENVPQHASQPWAFGDPSLPIDSRSKLVNGHSFPGNFPNLSYADSNFVPSGSGRFQAPAYGQLMPDQVNGSHGLMSVSTNDGADGSSTSTSDQYSGTTSRRRSPGIAREATSSSARNAGNPPAGVMRCASCKVTQSPEWRKGPNGKKELCNA